MNTLVPLHVCCVCRPTSRSFILWILYIYNPDIPVDSVDYTLITPHFGTHTFTVSSPCHSHSTNFCSTWYPLLLSGQRRCEFKACPRLLHMTSGAKIEPNMSWSQVERLKHSTVGGNVCLCVCVRLCVCVCVCVCLSASQLQIHSSVTLNYNALLLLNYVH